MKFTVTWHSEAQAELARVWINARDRDDIAQAANLIDATLRYSPRAKARPVGDRLGVLTVAPLEVVFGVSDADRIVNIVAVRSLTSPT